MRNIRLFDAKVGKLRQGTT